MQTTSATVALEKRPLAAARGKPHWQKIGIEVREIENRRWLGRDATGKSTYKTFDSSWQVIIPAKVTGKHRIRKQFADKKSAILHAEGQGDLHRSSGPRAFQLSDFEREDAAKALPILRELELTFLQAAELARKHLRPEAGDITMRDLVKRIIQEKERKNLRPDSLRTLRWNFHRLEKHFGLETLVKNVTAEHLRQWVEQLEANGHKGRNLRNYIRYAKQFFAYAHNHKFRAEDPAELLELPVVEWKAPCILSIQETKDLLRTALWPKYRDLLPALTLQLFVGGLRTEEVSRLPWEAIDLAARKVDITPAVGKNRRDGDWRFADIPPNAVEFLMLHKSRIGKVAPEKFKTLLTSLHKDAGFEHYDRTHKNAKRHSFGSYGCKLHGPTWVQEQMGHNTRPTFLKFYRNARITKEAAQEYFELTPENVGANAEPESFPMIKPRAAS